MLQLPYLRIPGWEKIKRNEIVVFNQPADTLLDMNVFTPDRNYYKPIDKKTNLVKRCVGISGDTLQIIDGYVYINGIKNELPGRARLQFSYKGKIKEGKRFSRSIYNRLKTYYDITDGFVNNSTHFEVSAATKESIELLKKHPSVASIERKIRALSPWPGVWTVYKNKRLKILAAHLDKDILVIDKVQPEGKKPMSWDDYTRGN